MNLQKHNKRKSKNKWKQRKEFIWCIKHSIWKRDRNKRKYNDRYINKRRDDSKSWYKYKINLSGKNIYETNGNLTVDDVNMKFTENIVNRNKDYSQSIVKLNEAGKKIELKGVGSIEITDNKFIVQEKGTDKTKKLSALDLSSEETSIASGNRNEG